MGSILEKRRLYLQARYLRGEDRHVLYVQNNEADMRPCEVQKDVSKNTYSWITTGGCYKDNKAVLYEDAYPGDIVNFKDVQFEVRMDKR